MIEPYSARKNNANPILAYSTLNPDTSSDSASGKSKGARFVSAKIDIKNIKKSGKKGIAKNIRF